MGRRVYGSGGGGGGQVNLATGVTGTLPVANGGTGQTTALTVIDLYANRPAGFTGQRFIPTDGGREQVYNGSAWCPMIGHTIGKEPAGSGSFTALNSASITKTNGILKLVGGTSGQMSGADIQYSSSGCGTPTIIGRVQFQGTKDALGATSKYFYGGIGIRETASGKMGLTWICSYASSAGANQLGIGYTKATSVSAVADSTYYVLPGVYGTVWLRIKISGGNLVHAFSFDRCTWTDLPILTSSATSSYFTTTGSGNYNYGVYQWAATSGEVSYIDDLEQG